MDYVDSSPFLTAWHQAMIIGSIIMFAAGVIFYLIHNLRLSTITDFHAKYDYINSKEIANYKVVAYCFGVAAALIINRYGMDKLKEVEVWFFARLIISVAGGTLVGYVGYLVLEYYYPTVVNRKLLKWRYMPRTNPNTGSKMRLLSEEEEDVHLDMGMQAEENIFSIDYDVWVDEKTGEVKIEKYAGHLQALKCNSCGFYTMKVLREEVTKPASATEPGELVKYYQCSYCKSNRATAYNISSKQSAEDYRDKKFKFRLNKDIELIKLEVHSSVKGKKYYEFQNVEEAQRFLTEFDFDKSN
jgi:hypothetical protein